MASFLHGLKQYVYSSYYVESYYNHKSHILKAFFLHELEQHDYLFCKWALKKQSVSKVSGFNLVLNFALKALSFSTEVGGIVERANFNFISLSFTSWDSEKCQMYQYFHRYSFLTNFCHVSNLISFWQVLYNQKQAIPN